MESVSQDDLDDPPYEAVEEKVTLSVSSPKEKRKKHNKIPRYLQSAPIRPLVHPLDRNVACSFILSVFFVALAIISGLPIVAILSVLLPFVMLTRHLFARYCSCNKVLPCCSRQVQLVSALDAYWLHDSDFNFYITHCLLFVERNLGTDKLRDLIMVRIINKMAEDGDRAFPRFVQRILPVSSGYCWVDDEEFDVDNHVFEDSKEVRSKQQLRQYVAQLMSEALPMERPLWEIRILRNFGKSKDTVLIVRIHQAVSDGISLVRIFSSCFSDNQQTLHLKSRFGGSTFPLNAFRALIVGPLTFVTWLLCMRRDYNFFCRSKSSSTERTVWWSRDIKFSDVNRVKQVTRSSFNDVLLCAVSGAVRNYFRRQGILNPPDVTVNIPVDLRYDSSSHNYITSMGTEFAMVNAVLPSNTEGAIPRLWEVRHLMEELKTSADPVVMYGATFFLMNLLPHVVARWLLGLLHRKASVAYCSLPGPDDQITIGSQRLWKAVYWMARPDVPVAFSIFSYGGTFQVAVSTDKTVVPDPKVLVSGFRKQIDQLCRLLSKRRVPGEHRRRSSYMSARRRQEEIIKPPFEEIQQKLHDVQDELHEITQKLEAAKSASSSGDSPVTSEYQELSSTHAILTQRMEQLKEEFSELITELRRRKSLADGIVINVEDEDDMEGELRRPRKRALSTSSRRSSFSALMSTARPLTTISGHHSISIPPSPEMDIPYSPMLEQQRALLYSVNQVSLV